MTEKTTSAKAEEARSKYELMVIFHPDTGEEGTAKRVSELKKLIEENGGEVWNEDNWGLRELAYTIKRQTKGYYYVLNFTLLPGKLKKIDKYMKLEKDFIRNMIMKVSDTYKVKSMQEYLQEAEEEEKAKPKEEDNKGERKGKIERERPVAKKIEKKEEKPAPKPEPEPEPKPKSEPKPEPKAEKPVEEAPEEVKEAPKEEPVAEQKDKKKELDDLDAKLQSIINDSDIIL